MGEFLLLNLFETIGTYFAGYLRLCSFRYCALQMKENENWWMLLIAAVAVLYWAKVAQIAARDIRDWWNKN